MRIQLPAHLAPRIHPGGPRVTPDSSGRYVLYWMRTAVRAHDNPALDVAVTVARHLGLPFFVYHAVSERYPWASDRHHRFILEGARDVAREMAEWGVGYALHVERPGHRGPHLLTLAAQAALVVTEDMPVQPLMGWTEAVARVAPVWAVDSACLAPMRSADPSTTTRAFRYRKATQALRERWLTEPWPDVPVPGDGWLPELPFEPVDPSAWPSPSAVEPGASTYGRASHPVDPLAELIAACAIDHGVAPVPHSPGGSRAGYARWQAFLRDGIGSYARLRNQPLRFGVSRMSPYLHYGHVSPFRLAREAHAAGGQGAEKFLDEMLVWREMAYAFCAAHPGHASLRGLPRWARETLAAHRDDPRHPLSWERMARGRTGDEFWDAAQHSLLIHGELHNNVRMTWGKAVLPWSPDAASALERIIDLNHRYALDGRDPASYGGILWCLGQFDRPFAPERPVFGSVRPRSTESHARRLDVDRYGALARTPAWPEPPSVAVVGAGLAGLMAARTLADHGLQVTVFDKGRRPGGRANTREHGDRRFDHGAQFFTVRDPVLGPYLDSWREDGVVAKWASTLVHVGPDGVTPATDVRRWVGTPGMIALATHLASELELRVQTRIEVMSGGPGDWRLQDAEGEQYGPFDRVVLALPAPQSAALVEAHPDLHARVAAVEMEPCWAVMVEFAEAVPVDFDGAFVEGDVLSWVARDSAKPGRPAGERWVLHASAEWSRSEWDTPSVEVVASLVAALERRLGLALPEVTFGRAHRWGYAAGGAAVEGGAIHDPDSGLVLCGDWCLGGRVEGALLSGRAAAGRVLGEGPSHTVGRGGPLAAGVEPDADPEQRSLDLVLT